MKRAVLAAGEVRPSDLDAGDRWDADQSRLLESLALMTLRFLSVNRRPSAEPGNTETITEPDAALDEIALMPDEVLAEDDSADILQRSTPSPTTATGIALCDDDQMANLC